MNYLEMLRAVRTRFPDRAEAAPGMFSNLTWILEELFDETGTDVPAAFVDTFLRARLGLCGVDELRGFADVPAARVAWAVDYTTGALGACRGVGFVGVLADERRTSLMVFLVAAITGITHGERDGATERS